MRYIYKHIGFYNQTGDIRELAGKPADVIVDYYKKGLGAFFADDNPDDTDTRLVIDEYAAVIDSRTLRVTSDKRYAVFEAVSYGWDDCMEAVDVATDSYIDIYECDGVAGETPSLPYENSIIISLFRNFFTLKHGGDEPVLGEVGDEEYTVALDDFHLIASAIEELCPKIAEGYGDDITWYDEYTDIVVDEFLHYMVYKTF